MVSLSVDRAGRVGLGRIGVEGSVLDTSDMMLVYNYQVIKEVKVSKIRVGDSHLYAPSAMALYLTSLSFGFILQSSI